MKLGGQGSLSEEMPFEQIEFSQISSWGRILGSEITWCVF